MIRLLLLLSVLAVPAAAQTTVPAPVIEAVWARGLEAAEMAAVRADDAFRDPRLDSLLLEDPGLNGVREGDLAWLDSLVASGGAPALSAARERDVRSRLVHVSHLAALASGTLVPALTIEIARATPGPDGVEAALSERPGAMDAALYQATADLVLILADAGDQTERLAQSTTPLDAGDADDWADWAAAVRLVVRRVRDARAEASR